MTGVYLTGVPVILNSPSVGKNLMNHVSYSVNFIVKNASNFEDLNMDAVRQYVNTRKGPMSSTGMSQVKYEVTSKHRPLVTFILHF